MKQHRVEVWTPHEPTRSVVGVRWEVKLGDEVWDDQPIATVCFADGAEAACLADTPLKGRVTELFARLLPASAEIYCMLEPL
ncbi:MAG: hypothetical protein KDD82_24490 [Planctomycetes bacterium]|nr:hypothetical protein [Planctomycetota bacterium]